MKTMAGKARKSCSRARWTRLLAMLGAAAVVPGCLKGLQVSYDGKREPPIVRSGEEVRRYDSSRDKLPWPHTVLGEITGHCSSEAVHSDDVGKALARAAIGLLISGGCSRHGLVRDMRQEIAEAGGNVILDQKCTESGRSEHIYEDGKAGTKTVTDIRCAGRAVRMPPPRLEPWPQPVASSPAPKPAEPAGREGPFDVPAAREAVFRVLDLLPKCSQPDGPTGEAKVAVTFAPTGKASRVELSEPYDGTEVGDCMEAVFLALTVPPFAGKPVRLAKTFELE